MSSTDPHLEPLPDTKLLRLFDTLYAVGSVTGAAQRLGLSQPTISIWLAQLRVLLKDPLFVRTSQGMQPTPRAQALIGTVRTALDALRNLTSDEQPFDPAQTTRRFRIGMSDASHVNLLPQLLRHLRQAAPHVSLLADPIDSTLPERLQSGEADLAIGLIPELGAGFYQQTLFTQDWVCLANADHPRISKKMDLHAYQSESHIEIMSGTGHELLSRALRRGDIERSVILELPGFLGLAAVLSETDLIATVPRQTGETLARSDAIRLFACPFPIPPFTVKQHWHTRFHNDPGNQWLRRTCSALFLHTQPINH